MSGLDPKQVERGFDRVAHQYEQQARLQKQVRENLLARQEWLKLAPDWILDLGSACATPVQDWQGRYPKARVISLDLSGGMLAEQGGDVAKVQADAQWLPLRDACLDLVFSNLMLQWCNDLAQVFAEARRVLRPGGALLFSCLGAESLRELRVSWQEADQETHVHDFPDIHDLGDHLTQAGLCEIVLDRDVLREHFPDSLAAMRSLQKVGAGNRARTRAKVSPGKQRLRKMTQAYEKLREDAGLPLSYEILYGLAWCPRTTPTEHAVSLEHMHETLRRRKG